MITLEQLFFCFAMLMVLVGGICTVAARNPIRGAMGLLTTIVGTAGMFLLLSAEFLAAIQIIVYAGAVVVLFLFVIMLLGPSATSGGDGRSRGSRFVGAGVFLASSAGAIVMLSRVGDGKPTLFPPAPAGLGSIEAIGHQLFTTELTPFELSSALLLVAVVGAVAVARGKQPDPTLLPAEADVPAPVPASSPVAPRLPVAAHGHVAHVAHVKEAAK